MYDNACFQEMPQTVNLWTKFLELRCIIDSSLQNIEDRWKEGKVRDYCVGREMISRGMS